MAWGDLTSNQMVSFTDAQGGGFPLQPGQSHDTSNQCMTKSESLAKYVIDPSYMTSYSDNQLVPKSTWVVNSSTVFSDYNSIGYTGTINGTVTVIETSATFTANALLYGSGNITTTITIDGNTRSASRSSAGTTTSTSFTLSPGSYSYTLNVVLSSGSGQGYIGVIQ